jgi:ferrous iron transport protein B
MRQLRIALIGNPNTGKTTIFNQLTGLRQQVANYPGVTVSASEGRFTRAGCEVLVTDLPGTYSLSVCSPDEAIARRFISEDRPDLVVNLVDAANLERNLYLTTQLMELGVPLLLAFTMSDIAAAKGISIDTARLSGLLGIPIVQVVGNRGQGIDALKDQIVALARTPVQPAAVRYGSEIEEELDRLVRLLPPDAPGQKTPVRWTALQLLEGDTETTEAAQAWANRDELVKAIGDARTRLHRHFGDQPSTIIAEQRYGFISGACQESIRMTAEIRHNYSDRVDAVLTHPLLGIPVFLAMMYLLFKFSFSLSEPPMQWIESGLNWLTVFIHCHWPAMLPVKLESLLVDGIISGVGGILIFMPNIILLFAAIAILEDSGYMSRAAFIADRFMHRLGLHGKSFIPFLVGFGCTVPAIMATRTLENRRDRLAVMMVLPLVSCSARLPIYGLFLSAFFPLRLRTLLLMGIYGTGLLLALGLAWLLRTRVLRGDPSFFVMELPPYRLPTLRGISSHTWERGMMFLKKAGTLIVGISIVLWFLTHYPAPAPERLQGLTPHEARGVEIGNSYAARIGKAIEPVMRPVGFDWKTSTALLGALAAKEVFVAQLGIIHSAGQKEPHPEQLRASLRREYTPLQALCIMLFCLISIPCVSTVAAIRAESGKWRWALAQFIGLTTLAWCITFIVYQAGTLLLRWLG